MKMIQHCSVARAGDILGDPWSFLVLREAFFGVRRFETMQKNLGIARNLLASRLKNLTGHGLFARVPYSARPPRYEYRLSERGQELYDIIVAMLQWGDRWNAGESGPPLLLFHRTCGSALHQIVVCSECREPIVLDDLVTKEGPGGGVSRRGSTAATRHASDRSVFTRGRHCSVARTLQIVGDRWTFLILHEAFFGARRFEDMQRSLRIARNILADRLSRLVADGIFERRLYAERPDRFEYALSEKGKELYPVVLAMLTWGDRWLAPSGQVPLLFIHKGCGKTVTFLFVCEHCGQPLHARDVRYEPGPGAGFRGWQSNAAEHPAIDARVTEAPRKKLAG